MIKKQNFVILIQRVSKLSISKENLKDHNQDWSDISDDPGSENYLYAQDPFEVKCQPIIIKRENAGLKH